MARMDFLQLSGKRIVIFGVANKKSVAYAIARSILECGGEPIFVVRSEKRREELKNLLEGHEIFVCDVQEQTAIDSVARAIGERFGTVDGLVHSIAFADYSDGIRPFHETTRRQFLQSIDVSCYSLIAIAKAFQEILVRDASVVTISISTTRMASESYGFMAPVKAALDSSIVFLAKSFSRFSNIRFNAVGAGLLKTSASAGIPGYVDAYFVCRASHLARQRIDDAGSSRYRHLPPQPSLLGNQRSNDHRRCRHVD